MVLRNFLSTPPQLFLACFEPIAAPLRPSQLYQKEGFLRYIVDSPKGENPHLRPRAPASKPEDLLEIVGFLCGSPGLIFGL